MDERRMNAMITKLSMTYGPQLERMGLQQGTVGFNRAMFNVLDVAQDTEELLPAFMEQLPAAIAEGATIEAIAKARANAFQDPQTKEWLYNPEAYKNYEDLYADQRIRAAGYDYQGKLG